MLKYKYAQNPNDLTLPYHIHGIASDTASVQVYINGNLYGNFKPNMFDKPDKYLFTRHFVPEETIVQLFIVGSRQDYGAKDNASIFNQDTAVTIMLENGLTLFKDQETGRYSWDDTRRSRFYANPHYFDSEFLWNLTIGYAPTKTTLSYQWPLNYEQELFLPSVITVSDSNYWSGTRDVPDIEPMVNDPYDIYDHGEIVNLNLDAIIDLKTLKQGDHIEISNGSEKISFDVRLNEETQFIYENLVETCHPIVHQDILTVNPNGKVHYAKGLGRRQQELVTLTLYDKQIQFTIRRT